MPDQTYVRDLDENWWCVTTYGPNITTTIDTTTIVWTPRGYWERFYNWMSGRYRWRFHRKVGKGA